MKKKVRVLRRRPSPCDEVEDNRTEFQQKIPEKEIQVIVPIKSEPAEETPGDFVINPEPIDDPPQAPELDDIRTEFKNEPELNIIDGDFAADSQENSILY
jgi:hypothetical protein